MSKKPKENGPKKGSKPKKRSPVGWVLTILIGLVVLYSVGSAGLCWMIIRPNDRGLMLEPSSRGVAVGEVEFEASDGVKLRGWFSQAPDKPVVLLAHGRRAHRGQFRALYSALYLRHALGFFCFDFRGSGRSDGYFSTSGVKEALDLEAALDWLIKKGYDADEIALVAADMGALAAIQMPERLDELAACVLIAPSEDGERRLQRMLRQWRIPLRPTATLALAGAKLVTKTTLRIPDLEENYGKLHYVPLLFLAGEKDTVASPELVRGWMQLVPGSDKKLQVLAGTDHDKILDGENDEVTGTVLGFLKEKLDY